MLTVIFLFLKNLALNYMKYESMGHNKKGKEKKNSYFKACDATIERRRYYIVNRLEWNFLHNYDRTSLLEIV